MAHYKLGNVTNVKHCGKFEVRMVSVKMLKGIRKSASCHTSLMRCRGSLANSDLEFPVIEKELR